MTAFPAISLFKSSFLSGPFACAPVSLLDRPAYGCAFPVGEAGGDAQLYCGAPACSAARRRARSYCADHYPRMGAGAPEVTLEGLGVSI